MTVIMIVFAYRNIYPLFIENIMWQYSNGWCKYMRFIRNLYRI